jgi:anti-sigma-K factor RskA
MVHDQAAGFALNALSAEEARAFEDHLGSCPGCQDALEPFQAAAAALAFAGELASPPPELRVRVLDLPGGVAIPLRRRWVRPLLTASVAAAAAAAIALGVHGRTDGQMSAAGLQAYSVSGAKGSLLVSRTGEAVLLVRGLPPAPAGKTYELWVVRDGTAVSAGFMRGQIGPLTRPVGRGAAVAVSLERMGGSPRPTGPLLLRAETT